MDKAHPDVAGFLSEIARELAEIHRGSDCSLWRGEAKHRVDQYLSQAKPFSDFAECWVFSGDGAGSVVSGRFALRHQARDKGDIAREPIEFGDQHRALCGPSSSQCRGQLWPAIQRIPIPCRCRSRLTRLGL